MGGRAALIFILGFSFLMGYTIMNLNQAATRAVGNTSTYNTMTASHNLALAGANVGLAKLYRDTSWGSSSTGTLSQSFSSGPLIGSFTVTVTRSGDTKTLISEARYPGADSTDKIIVTLGKNITNSFALFAWMTNSENSTYWITGDTVWGQVHSNDNFYVSGKPVFMRQVTTSKNFKPPVGKSSGGYTNSAIFKNPPQPETGVQTIDIPNDLSAFAAAADSSKGGKTYKFDTTWVILDSKTSASGDGKAYIKSSRNGSYVDSIRLADTSFDGVIMGTKVVAVQGKLDGRLTIGSYSTPTATNNNLIITGDIFYEKNPQAGPSDDQLGLVANNNVVVADNIVTNGNREIDGSIFCRTGSFTAENYTTRSIDGQLRVLGSIVQNTRGAIGTFSGTTIKTGFLKAYRYDDRLLDPTARPPYYPGWLQKNYAILNWWESYRVMPLNLSD